MEAPAGICVLDGPELVFELVNPRYRQLLPERPLLGRPLLEALPELAGHPVVELLRRVYAHGINHDEQSLLIPVMSPGGELEDRYLTLLYQPRYEEKGRVDGVLVFVFEVTQEALTRQQAERSEQEFRMLLVKYQSDYLNQPVHRRNHVLAIRAGTPTRA